MEKQEHICARCAAKEKGCMDCCTEPFLDADSGFCLTFSDIIRISRHTGLSPEAFCSVKRIDEKNLRENPDDSCDELHHNGLWLGMKGEGRCMFLGERGCTIFQARPMMCRVHPFWLEVAGNSVKAFIDRSPGQDKRLCVVEDSGRTDNRIAEMLSGSVEALVLDVQQFAREMELNRKYLPLLETADLGSVLGLVEKESLDKPKGQPSINNNKPAKGQAARI